MNESRTRREFLSDALARARIAAFAVLGGSFAAPAARAAGADDFGPLQPPDANGLRLPLGFSARVVAVTGSPVPGTSFVWHEAPDGGATFATPDGGWIYVSNSEVGGGLGGVGAIRFDASGAVVSAYSILTGTRSNCAGGPTPWQTWLSCEETSSGWVYECDPFSAGSQGVAHPAMGAFKHEAAAVDDREQRVYLTEDQPDGRLYRFTPDAYPDLSSGTLEAAEILDPLGQGPIAPGQSRPLAWHVVPDPSAATQSTRYQVPAATGFDGGEGCCYQDDAVFFSTKGDNRVWQLDTQTQQLTIRYDRATSSTPILSGVDNLLGLHNGDLYVAEDGGDLEVVALTSTGQVRSVLQMTGQTGTEVTGLAISPDGTRLYLSSQRNPGTTYEVRGPFGAGAAAVPGLGGVGRAAVVATALWAAWRRLRPAL